MAERQLFQGLVKAGGFFLLIKALYSYGLLGSNSLIYQGYQPFNWLLVSQLGVLLVGVLLLWKSAQVVHWAYRSDPGDLSLQSVFRIGVKMLGLGLLLMQVKLLFSMMEYWQISRLTPEAVQQLGAAFWVMQGILITAVLAAGVIAIRYDTGKGTWESGAKGPHFVKGSKYLAEEESKLLKEREVFQEILRVVGLGMLVYGVYMLVQSRLSMLMVSDFNTILWLMLARPVVYTLVGAGLIMRPFSLAAFAYPLEQAEEWSYRQVFTIGVKLCGIWLIMAHLTGFLYHLRYYVQQVPMVGRYQVGTHDIWTAAAIYAVFIAVGLIMLRYQPR